VVPVSRSDKLEKLLTVLKWMTEEAIEKARALTSDRHFYCPECLTAVAISEEEKPKCSNCGVELRPVDEHFKAEYARALREFCERASKIAERVWPVLESWSRGIVGYLTGEGLVGVIFGEPRGNFNALVLFREGRDGTKALLGIFNMSERELDKLAEIIRVLREEGSRGKVEIRAGLVPKEKLKGLGFKKFGDTWHLEL
jgi:hypothetical protein